MDTQVLLTTYEEKLSQSFLYFTMSLYLLFTNVFVYSFQQIDWVKSYNASLLCCLTFNLQFIISLVIYCNYDKIKKTPYNYVISLLYFVILNYNISLLTLYAIPYNYYLLFKLHIILLIITILTKINENISYHILYGLSIVTTICMSIMIYKVFNINLKNISILTVSTLLSILYIVSNIKRIFDNKHILVKNIDKNYIFVSTFLFIDIIPYFLYILGINC
jgi:hypothetical protein